MTDPAGPRPTAVRGGRDLDAGRVRRVQQAALRIRHRVLDMAEVQGQGYVGQALGLADVLAVLYSDLLHLPSADAPDRDRLLLSAGHYAVALYAGLAEAGLLDEAELATYGSDDSRLPMSGMSTYTPGMEISGGSLGHGLGLAVGMALALRLQDNPARVVNLMSDGELNEGATWEAALVAPHYGLDRLLVIVDVNGLQADGPTSGVLRVEPLEDKWRSFGWACRRADGNDIPALLTALDSLTSGSGGPPVVLLCDTRPGRGVPFLEARDRAHFLRVDDSEWLLAHAELDREEKP
jgi:transketolase